MRQTSQTYTQLRRVQHADMFLERCRLRLLVFLPFLLTPTTSSPPQAANIFHLTTESFSPLHYELVVYFSEEGETLHVMTSVTATCRRPGHSLRLDFRPDACHVYSGPFRRSVQNCADYTFEGNRTYNIKVRYRLKLKTYGGLFYKTDSVARKRKILLSNFKLDDLRGNFLVIGQLQDRPTFKIKVSHPIGTIAVSNSESVMQTRWGSSLRTSFELGNISYRQLSVAVFPISGYRRRNFGRTSVWFHGRQRNNLGKFAVLWTHQMVETLYESLQVAPIKLDVLVLPGVTTSASKGIVVLPEKDALVNDASSSSAQKHSVAKTLAVNLAASWFYGTSNLTPADAWLPGALANYYGTHLAGKIAPEWQFNEFFVAKVTRAALGDDIRRKLPSLSRASDSLTNATTLKGAAVLKMLANVVEPLEVDNTLKYLLEHNALSTANIIHGFRKSFSAHGKDSILGTVFGSWVDQEGYPLLSVTRNYKEGTALVTQEPFLGASESTEQWWVPLTYMTSLDPKIRTTWMTPVSNGTRLRDLQRGSFHWLLLNPKGSGYYRVNYDRLQWSLLVQQLQDDHEQLAMESRVVLLDDAFTLARHRHLEFSTPLSMVMYLARETSPVVWTVVIRHFDAILAELSYGDRHKLQNILDDWVSTRVTGTTGDHNSAFLKNLLGTWSCKLQLPSCKLLKEDKDLREAVLCRTARTKSVVSAGLLEDVFRADPAVVRPTLLAALGCSSDRNILTRLVNSSAHGDHGLEPVETFSAVAHNPMIPEIAVDVLNSVYRDTPWVPDVLRIIVESTTQEGNLFYMVESTRLLVLVVALASACVALKPVKPDTKADAPAQKRLKLTAIPSKYKIGLIPDLDAKTFTGTVDITAKVTPDPTKEIFFHAAETLTVLTGTVKLPDNETKVVIAKVPDTSDVYMATWTPEAPKDKDITLSLTYSGVITEDMDGFYISTYLDGTTPKILASTQFESVSARKAFPCLDEPALKATFDMTITVPDTYGVLFNTEEQASTKADPASVEHTFKTTPAMSTYLVAFVIYDKATFTPSKLTSDERQAVWSRKDLAGQRDTALNAGSQVLAALTEKFGIKYFEDMIPKMDQIAIPDFSAGAMENWGLVTYRESSLLADAATTSTSDRRDVIETVAHEFAHQWFGDLVSPNYWDVLWLNEGFATYWMYHVPIDAYKDFNMEGAFVAIDMETALEADAYETTHAMTYPVTDGYAFEGKFDDITYEKAGSVIRMMRHILGNDTAFDEGLKNYLDAKKNGAALPKDLFDSLTPDGDTDFVARMQSWSDSAGYPVIKVERDIEKDTATISQSRYYLKSSEGANKDIPWKTPIIVLDIDTPTNVSIVTWLDGDKAATINNLVDDVPLIINPKRAGFFRVNYDVMNWELIGSMLQNNITRVDAVTRAALISDAFSMARSGHLDYSTALDLSTYLVNEVEYVPWEAAFRHLSFLNSRLVSSDVYNGFKTYVGSLLKKTYDAVGFEIKDTETPENRIHRENVLSWACKIGHQTCSDKAKALDTPDETKMEPDLRAVVLCESVRTNDSRWDELRQEFVKSTSATDKLVTLNALGCSDNEEKLQTLLEMARNATQVRPQDLSKAYAAVYNNPKGVDLVLADIGNNTADLVQQFSGLQKILSGLGDKLTTQDQIDKFKALTGLGNAQSAYETALAKAQANLQWLTDNEEKLTTWINKYNSAASATVSILLLAVAAISAFLNH